MPLPPTRIVDSRNGLGTTQAPLEEATSRSFHITGAGGVPLSGVSAVVLSVTATDASADTWFTVWPTGQTRPTVSQLSVTAGNWEANTVITKIGTGGDIDVFNRWGRAHVILDVQGYFTDSTVTAAGGTFVAVTPSRVYDTNLSGRTPLVGGEIRDIQVTGLGGVPTSGVSAVAVNLTVDNTTVNTSVQAFPSGGSQPGVSTLQASAGQIASALAQVKLGAGGKISVFANLGQMRLIVDVEGYYLDSTQSGRDLYVPISPRRIYTSSTDFAGGETRAIQISGAKDASGNVVVPSTGVTSVVVSVTAVQPAAKGIMIGWPAGQPRPVAQMLSYNLADNNVTGTAILALGTGGKLNIYSSAASGLTIDVQGYFQSSVDLKVPELVYATGAKLDWAPYVDPSSADANDIVEYQVHRSTNPEFTPSAATLVAPVDKTATTYTDTTAIPTPADSEDLYGATYYYRLAVKTKDGGLTVSKVRQVRLPKAGRIVRLLQGPQETDDATLSLTPADTPRGGETQLWVSSSPGVTGGDRAVFKFDLSSIPAGAVVVDSRFSLWRNGGSGDPPLGTSWDVHKLTQDFDEPTVTWNKASAATSWTPGGAYDTAVAGTLGKFTGQTGAWSTWNVKGAVIDWMADPDQSSNHGLLMLFNGSSTTPLSASFLSSEADGFGLQPKLEVTYLEKTAESTYYAPYTPARMVPGDTYPVDVTVTNTTGAEWAASDWVVSYRWALPDGSPVPKAGSSTQTALTKDVQPGDSVTVSAPLKAPINSDSGNKRNDYVLQWELFNKVTGQWLSDLSQTPKIPPLVQNTTVEDPTSNQLGLEKFYSYVGKNTGAGSAVMTNTFAGNTVWSYDAFSNPSRGISTFVRLAYNSLDTSDTVAGYGWSLQASSLTRLGTPLDFHPNKNPTEVTLTDGDGTSHIFSWDATANEWTSPAGVHLFLQRLVECDNKTEESRAWVMTRPDRTKFFFDCDGYLSAIADNNDNELTFTYEQRQSNNQPTKFLKRLTDAEGRDTLTLDYYAKGDGYKWIDDAGVEQSGSSLTNPHIIDHLRQLTDISGRTITFTYTDKGLMAKMVDGAGDPLAKTFKFAYDAAQGNKNVKLVKVTDPRVHDTKLDYYTPVVGDDPKFHWFAKTITDRLEGGTTFTYTDPDGQASAAIQTQVKDAEGHTSTFVTDGFGRPAQTTNAKSQTTKVRWDNDNNVERLEEDGGAVTTWKYDPQTGYPLLITDAEANKNGTAGTNLEYNGDLLKQHIAQLDSKTSPEGRKWEFTYTPDGDLETVTDPAGTATAADGDYVTAYTYDEFGQLRTSEDANGNVTKYDDYELSSGYPQLITDPYTHTTGFEYNKRGMVTTVTDAYEKDTTQEYDLFGRPGKRTEPKDEDKGEFIVTPAPVYDANDNVKVATAPNGAVYTATYDAGDQLETSTEPKDTSGGPERKSVFTYDKVGNLKSETEPKGTLTTTDPDDFVTSYGYDEIYQLISVTNAEGDEITYGYDNVGNLKTVVDPRKNASEASDDFTAKYSYNLNHQVTVTTDADGHTTGTGYDLDGLVKSTKDQDGNETLITLDERGKPSQVQVPHKNDGGVVYHITQYKYDEVGNTTKVISPRGVDTPEVDDDFVTETVYDKLNRVKEQLTPYKPGDPDYHSANRTTYTYDKVGRLEKVLAPPSAGDGATTNDTTFTYFDNGWTETSTDPWDITTVYDYTDLGQQKSRTLTAGGAAGDGADRAMSWTYYPDGKLATRSDDGVPAGAQIVVADNSDTENITKTGTWTTGTTGSDHQGTDYATHAAGAGTDAFTWELKIPQDGTYQVFVRYPQVTGAASSAAYTVTHATGTAPKTVNQTTNTGSWVSLGSFTFDEDKTNQKVTLAQNATGVVTADAIKLVRDRSGDPADDEKSSFEYGYDPNGNLTDIADLSPKTAIGAYKVTYDGLNQVEKVEEKASSDPDAEVKHTTSFGYDENGNPKTRTHDGQPSAYDYDNRDLLSKVTDKKSASDADPKVTSFTYTSRGEREQETKGNGNTVEYSYYLDGLLKHQLETKPNGTVVTEHTLTYDPNGNRKSDVAVKMNADNHAATLSTTSDYTYDPLDRIAQVTKTGTGAGTETYKHDANNNVITQTIKGVETDYDYQRNRLQSATTGGVKASYNYDPFGRLDTVTAAGKTLERYVYDGFDRISQYRKLGETGSTSATNYTYDPLDRTSSKTVNAGATGEKTTTYDYLALTDQVLTEAVGGEVTKSYQYSPWGERLSQVTHKAGGVEEDGYYGYSPHTDVETLTDDGGDTKATYGYTAYGNNDDAQFTGIDKPDTQDPTKEPYNPYRYTAKRWDSSTASYDMGFRDYSPGLNRFLSRDSYNGALADMNLTTDPFTGNRYAFAAGNPITRIELDGHMNVADISDLGGSGSGDSTPTPTPSPQAAPPQPSDHGSGSSGEGTKIGLTGVPPIWRSTAVRAAADDLLAGAAEGAVRVVGVLGLLLMTCGDSPQAAGCQDDSDGDNSRCEKRQGECKKYVTYTKVNSITGQRYTGRTSGWGTPAQIVAARDSGHHRTAKDGWGAATPDRSTVSTLPYAQRHSDPAYQAIRGREQQLIDFWGGAKSDGGTSGNSIRGIARDNPRLPLYVGAATARFGLVESRPGWTP
ncbi:DNRLRE domain-containing protein [Actinopolymorpha pittospori]|uniref:RHS repeat-associated protein n=1 Tax=Actinopolymorpha pittospori TaxID=648752 RepID=A0A927MRK9_9ACTN|nr:RHS repeat-associated protein [Actinopolymorpha pittospori]